eukprot:scaffold92560_cov30-Phaeocystis_antarctica.AAC.1
MCGRRALHAYAEELVRQHFWTGLGRSTPRPGHLILKTKLSCPDIDLKRRSENIKASQLGLRPSAKSERPPTKQGISAGRLLVPGRRAVTWPRLPRRASDPWRFLQRASI